MRAAISLHFGKVTCEKTRIADCQHRSLFQKGFYQIKFGTVGVSTREEKRFRESFGALYRNRFSLCRYEAKKG